MMTARREGHYAVIRNNQLIIEKKIINVADRTPESMENKDKETNNENFFVYRSE
jgi:hypothetical protein